MNDGSYITIEEGISRIFGESYRILDGKIDMTWYEEFNSLGSYQDDWEEEYLDSCGIMDYLDRLFYGCYDLIKIGSYQHAAKILGKICRLEFSIGDYKESEDSYSGTDPFSLDDVYHYNLLCTDRDQVAGDLIYAYYMSHKDKKEEDVSGEIANLLLLPICRKFLPGDVLKDEADQSFFQSLSKALEEKSQEIARLVEERISINSLEVYGLIEQQKHVQKMTDIFVSLIRAAWKQGNVTGAENYYIKAKRRKKIQLSKVEEVYNSLCEN